jgi:oligopeptide transport system ATP-binding protein
MDALLDVSGLKIHYLDPRGKAAAALNGLSLQLFNGTVLGILGESGSGKSTLGKALLRTLPRNAKVVDGRMEFEGQDLASLTEKQMNQVRGAAISMVAQEPGLALNPVLKVGTQIAEVLRAHRDWTARQCQARAEELLERVNLRAESRRMYNAYPHQLSGGQQQRVVIAQALACDPSLIIADEPTASLDAENEKQILELFRELKQERKTALLLITHNPEILRGLADRIAVLYAGRVVEDAPAEQIFHNALHPYAKALMDCIPPAISSHPKGYRLPTIKGSPQDQSLKGCSFSARCEERFEKCDQRQPVTVQVEEDHAVECFRYGN